MDLNDLFNWIKSLYKYLNENEKKIATEVIKEISNRLKFLLDVGLNYSSLVDHLNLFLGRIPKNKACYSDWIAIDECIIYFDEPSIGLHQRDNKRLISS